jgi:hypothetical protein
MYVKIPLFNPDRLLSRLVPYLRWLFTPWILVISGFVILSTVLLVATHFEVACAKLPSGDEFFSFKTVVYLWLALAIVKSIHEFAHGLTCKVFGADMPAMGLLFLCLTPCLYTDFSQVWKLPSKWHRLCVNGAGIYAEIVIASIATILWWNTPTQPFLNNLSICLIVICSVSTVLFNACPLIHFDGFYIVCEWLGQHEFFRLVRNSLWATLLLWLGLFARYFYCLALTLLFTWFLFTFFSRYRITLPEALLPLLLVVDFHRWLSIRTYTFSPVTILHEYHAVSPFRTDERMVSE